MLFFPHFSSVAKVFSREAQTVFFVTKFAKHTGIWESSFQNFANFSSSETFCPREYSQLFCRPLTLSCLVLKYNYNKNALLCATAQYNAGPGQRRVAPVEGGTKLKDFPIKF